MAFIGRDNFDPNEPEFDAWETQRAEKWLEGWHYASRPLGQPAAGQCPHEEDFCSTREQCVERVAWWLRYIREIENIA